MSLVADLRHPLHGRPLNRWVQVVASVVLMMAIAGVLFLWPLLRTARGGSLADSLAAIENAFAFFIIAETIFVPLEGWLGERFPRWMLVGLGTTLVVVGAVAGAQADGRAQVAWSALGGAGAGLAYGGTVAKALRRFTDRKALCVGVAAAACAGVLALAIAGFAALYSPSALTLLVVLGAGQAAVILIATLFILYPPPEKLPPDW